MSVFCGAASQVAERWMPEGEEWYRWRDSNPHSQREPDFESSVSTNSTTPAREVKEGNIDNFPVSASAEFGSEGLIS